MTNYTTFREELNINGFAVMEGIFSDARIQLILSAIEEVDSSRSTFRKTSDLFAIRRFLKEVPESIPMIYTERLNALVTRLFGEDYFVVKSIYFDKPGTSNWYVSYHQDLTISVDQKMDLEGFGPWTVKQDQYAVQPPLEILENKFTLRIHLDDTDESNGALRVVPQSHTKGIYRPETIDWTKEREVTCRVPRGGVMLMRPLLLHASSRTTNQQRRRVIHIEFSNSRLPEPLQWSERMELNSVKCKMS